MDSIFADLGSNPSTGSSSFKTNKKSSLSAVARAPSSLVSTPPRSLSAEILTKKRCSSSSIKSERSIFFERKLPFTLNEVANSGKSKLIELNTSRSQVKSPEILIGSVTQSRTTIPLQRNSFVTGCSFNLFFGIN